MAAERPAGVAGPWDLVVEAVAARQAVRWTGHPAVEEALLRQAAELREAAEAELVVVVAAKAEAEAATSKVPDPKNGISPGQSRG
jgi:hypothetical protein